MIRKFTQNNDIKMIIQEKQISTNQIRSILKKKGIFSLVSNAEELAEEIYSIYFGITEIDKMKEFMQTEGNYKKSSLMTIVPKEDDKDIDSLLEDIEEQFYHYKTCNDGKCKIDSITSDENGQITMEISYIKKIKGKVSLINNVKKEVGVILKKDSDSSRILVDIRQNDNSDLKEFEKFLGQVNSLGGCPELFKIEHLSLDKLTKDNKIKFFDKLIAYRYSDWIIEDIKGIDVKREDKSAEEEDDDDEALSSDELVGITNAMFKGDSIRNTGIVKKFEKQGFYFTSMKFKYAYKKSAESFLVDINFKGTENVKIDIINTYDDTDRIIFPTAQQEAIIQKFQEVVNKVYKDIINDQIKDVK